MDATTGKALERLFERFGPQPEIQAIQGALAGAKAHPDALMPLYKQAIAFVEKQLWREGGDDHLTGLYQQLFQELEALIASSGVDRRHKFVIVIPVADRPQHLRNCLDSLLTLCRSFRYGGVVNQKYAKVTVLIADDSKRAERIRRHQLIAREFSQLGLETLYFGQREQLAEIDRLEPEERRRLAPIIGETDRSAFYHKGASIMRNIAYLKLNALRKREEKLLFYFIDSDQEFKVKVRTAGGERDRYNINYLYYLDRIFSTTDARILTGKVVGDPPVSPAVMAGNFLEDVIGFLTRIMQAEQTQACQFHTNRTQTADDASYHDMADLFGFKPASDAFHYQCMLTGEHDHLDCFNDFANRLNRFFDGEHPTRKSYYEHEALFAGLKPARTIYTGNYVFRPEALRFFIPFASLKLRMAGPVLGRLIKAQIKGQFVSANLPMLHQRTVQETGESEFRPGIHRASAQVDLSGEFERQFFGDVMLFAIEQLTARGYPHTQLPEEQIALTVQATEREMYDKYMRKRVQISGKLQRLRTLLTDPANWWNRAGGLDGARADFARFIDNMEHNFGDQAAGYQLIADDSHRQRRLEAICDAIARYAEERSAWDAALDLGGGLMTGDAAASDRTPAISWPRPHATDSQTR